VLTHRLIFPCRSVADSLDKSRRAEVESERHTSPNAHTRERMGRPPVSFASTLHDMCSLTCLIGIDRKLSLSLQLRCTYGAPNKDAYRYFHSTSMTMEGCVCMRKIQMDQSVYVSLNCMSSPWELYAVMA
jgi:hypothetical protein